MLIEQQVARALAFLRVADHDRHNMGLAQHDRQRAAVSADFTRAHILVVGSLRLRALQVADSGVAAAQIAVGSAVVKMEAGNIGADRIDKFALAATQPPRQPNAFASVPSITSMRCITPSAPHQLSPDLHI